MVRAQIKNIVVLDDIKKLEQRTYLKFLAGILIGILPITIFWNTRGTIAAILTIAGVLLILICLLAFSATFDVFYKLKGKLREKETGEEFRETYIDWPPWLKKWGGYLYFIIISIGFGFFASMHENDFGGNRFVWHSVTAGVIIGLLIFYILKLINTNWTTNRNKSYEIAFYIVLSTVFIFVCAGPSINKNFAVGPANCQTYPMKKITQKHKMDKGYINVAVRNRSERFKPGWPFYYKITKDDSVIILCVRKGALGYDYVEKFIMP